MRYGDIINVAISPGLEQAIAQALEDWVIQLSKKEEIDLLEEQVHEMKKIVQILIEHQAQSPS